MLDGDFVLSKGTRLQVKSKTANTIVLDSIVFGSQIRWRRGKKRNTAFEIIVFGQILPHKIGVSDLRSPNSQIQFRYTPYTIPIKDDTIFFYIWWPGSVCVSTQSGVRKLRTKDPFARW